VTITGKVDDVFVCECVQLLSEEEALRAKRSMQQMQELAIRNCGSAKRPDAWTAEASPAGVKRCRTLARYPTAPPLEPGGSNE